MPTPFVSICPHCQSKLKLKNPDLIGKKARCPSCQEPFVVKKAGNVAPASNVGASKPKPQTVPKPKPKPAPAEELDPWLNEDLGSLDAGEDRPPKSSGAAAVPPPLQGVGRKRKKSSPDDGAKKRKKKSIGADHVAWVGWVVGGGVAGLIGASIWGAIAAFTFSEWGILAWLLGGFVGFGVRVGARNNDYGLGPGLTALGIALASVVLGKFLALHFLLAAAGGTEYVEMTEHDTVQWIISDYANEIALDWEDEGRVVSEPDYENISEDAPASAYYDPEVWAAAENKWNALSQEKQAAEILAYQSGDFEFDDLEGAMFAGMFGILDLLWFFLAAATAFKVGSGLDFSDDE